MRSPDITVLEGYLGPILFDMGFELVDVAWFHQRGRWVLRVRVDKAWRGGAETGSGAGVTIDDCIRISRELGVHLDQRDVVDRPYALEISSPGLDRPLKKTQDFERFVGRVVKVHTACPLEGRSNWKGILREVEGHVVRIEVDRKMHEIPIEQIEKAALAGC